MLKGNYLGNESWYSQFNIRLLKNYRPICYKLVPELWQIDLFYPKLYQKTKHVVS